jgi:hypothetical protein
MYQCPAALERGSGDLFRIYDDPAQVYRACGGDVARNGEKAENPAELRLKRREKRSAALAGQGAAWLFAPSVPHRYPRIVVSAGQNSAPVILRREQRELRASRNPE